MKITAKTALRKRGIFLAALILALGGCVALQPTPEDRSPLFAERFEALSAGGNPVMVAGAGQGARVSVLVRDTINPPHDTWISAEGVSVTFHKGILSATRGLGHDLMSADVQGSADLIHAGGAGQITRIHRRLDGENQIVISSFICDISTRGPRDIEIAGQLMATRLMEENCTGPVAEFTNLYWVRQPQTSHHPEDGADAIVQSRQWAGPENGVLDMRRIGE